MIYNVPGITYSDVEGMPPWERKAFLELLLKQRKLEKEQQEEANSNATGKPADGFAFGRNDLMRPSVKGEVYGSKDPAEKFKPKPPADGQVRGGQPAKFIPGPGKNPPRSSKTSEK